MKRLIVAFVVAVTLSAVPASAASWYDYSDYYQSGGWFFGTLQYLGGGMCYALDTYTSLQCTYR